VRTQGDTKNEPVTVAFDLGRGPTGCECYLLKRKRKGTTHFELRGYDGVVGSYPKCNCNSMIGRRSIAAEMLCPRGHTLNHPRSTRASAKRGNRRRFWDASPDMSIKVDDLDEVERRVREEGPIT
jgi:hypothetical protein